MSNLIIFNKDIESIKIFTNQILNQIPNIKICGIATDAIELNSLVEQTNAEFLLISHSDFIKENLTDTINPKKLKIILYNCEKTSNQYKNKLFLSKDIHLDLAIQLMQSFISNLDTAFLRKRIIKILTTLNFNFKLNGTTYLLEAITYSYIHKDDYVFENLEKNVYPVVSKICKTSVQNVKWSIIRAINTINSNKSNLKTASDLIYLDFSEKPTAKYFISAIVTRL